MSLAADPGLRSDLARTLRDELGAEQLYRRLARSVRDPELARLVDGFALESIQLVLQARSVAAALGLRAREWSAHRGAVAIGLALLARCGASRAVLRLCQESEAILARRYQRFAEHLAVAHGAALAEACARLAARKSARARALAPWVPS